MSIRAKLVLAVSAGMLALVATAGALLRATGERSIRVASEQAIASAAQAYAAMERAHVEKLDTALRALSTNPALVDAFERRDRAKLTALVAPMFAESLEPAASTSRTCPAFARRSYVTNTTAPM